MQPRQRGVGHQVAGCWDETALVSEVRFVAAVGEGVHRRGVTVPTVGQRGDERVAERGERLEAPAERGKQLHRIGEDGDIAEEYVLNLDLLDHLTRTRPPLPLP